MNDPVRPFTAILGGAKVADKLNVISNLLEKVDTLIIGGGMAYTFIKAQGYEVGKSLCDDSKLDYCKEMMQRLRRRASSCSCPSIPPASRTSPTPSTLLSRPPSSLSPRSRLTRKAATSAPRP